MPEGHVMGAAAMAAGVCEEQVSERRDRRPCARTGGVTIGQLLARAHEGVHANATADCPLCGGAMHHVALEARCVSCGSRLA